MQHQLGQIETRPAPHGHAGVDIDFLELFALVLRSWPLILLYIVVFVLAAVGYLAVTPPSYTAQTLLLIDTRSNILPNQQVRATDANSEAAHVETQAEILRSDRIARSVILSQDLLTNPAFNRPSRVEGLKSWIAATPSLAWAAAWLPPDPAPVSEEVALSNVSKQFRRRTDIRRSQSTSIIEIRFQFEDPAVAANVSNAIANAYLAEQARFREQNARNTSTWLQQRMMDLRREAQAAETALDEFRNRNAATSGRGVLRELESTATTYRQVSDMFQRQFIETAQQQYFSIPDSRIVSEAWPPSDPSHPKKFLVLATAIAAGIACGFVGSLVRGKTRWMSARH